MFYFYPRGFTFTTFVNTYDSQLILKVEKIN